MGMTVADDRVVPRAKEEANVNATLPANLVAPHAREMRVKKKSRASSLDYMHSMKTMFLSYVIYVGSQETSFNLLRILHAFYYVLTSSFDLNRLKNKL